MKFMPGEFEFLENLKKRYALRRIGDDCAVIPQNSKTDLVITTDLLVEDVDFRLDWTRPEFVGHKALAVSLSDVAAMGATPVWAMLSVGVPKEIWDTDFVKKFYDGWFRLAKKFNVELVGGDVSRTPDKIVIDSIVAGAVKRGKAVLRSGAKPGDLIYVTNELGGAAAGLALLESGARYDDTATIWQKNLFLKQLQPLPQLHIAQSLNDENSVTAMIDLSDGLSSDLAHLCRASRVGAKIYADKIPLHKNLKALVGTFDEKLNYSIHGGEDFELLFTADPKKSFSLKKAHEKRGISRIGEITANAEIVELVSGEKIGILQPKGFRHF